jgi:transposase-like protein
MRIKIEECPFCSNKTVEQMPNMPAFTCTTCNTKFDLAEERICGNTNVDEAKAGIVGEYSIRFNIISIRVRQ